MRIANVALLLVLLPALSVARAEPPDPKTQDPPGLLEVPGIGIITVNGMVSFNQGRHFAISVNEHLLDAKASRAKLASALQEQKQLDDVVFDWFGTKPPAQLNLVIGDKVPVEMAQAVLAAYAVDSKLPVHIALLKEDGQLAHTRCVYIGSLVDREIDPVTPKQIQELLKPGLTREQFTKLLLKKKG